jgi:hypothetical protein
MVQFFFGINNETVGPLDEEAIRRRVSEGAITVHTLAWKQGQEGWMPVAEIPELMTAFGDVLSATTPPPLPGGAPPPLPSAGAASRAGRQHGSRGTFGPAGNRIQVRLPLLETPAEPNLEGVQLCTGGSYTRGARGRCHTGGLPPGPQHRRSALYRRSGLWAPAGARSWTRVTDGAGSECLPADDRRTA